MASVWAGSSGVGSKTALPLTTGLVTGGWPAKSNSTKSPSTAAVPPGKAASGMMVVQLDDQLPCGHTSPPAPVWRIPLPHREKYKRLFLYDKKDKPDGPVRPPPTPAGDP